MNEMFPVVPEDDCGAKVTVKGTLVPADTVTGKTIPFKLYPDPLNFAFEIVTSASLAVSDPVFSSLAPTGTLPKFMAAGVTLSPAASNPVPDRLTSAGWFVP
jgi:hypothetical protein